MFSRRAVDHHAERALGVVLQHVHHSPIEHTVVERRRSNQQLPLGRPRAHPFILLHEGHDVVPPPGTRRKRDTIMRERRSSPIRSLVLTTMVVLAVVIVGLPFAWNWLGSPFSTKTVDRTAPPVLVELR